MPDPITVYLQPGESISQALVRLKLIARDTCPNPITIPPEVRIIAPNVPRARITERRGFGIPFLNYKK